MRIHGTHQEEDYRYDGAGQLVSARYNDLLRRYATDPAGNRITDREQYPALPAIWRDNRISEDVQYFYHHDAHGRLTEKDERQIRDGGGLVHGYHYDNQHRLVHYRCEQQGAALLESRYLYDPLGRRIGKRVRTGRRERGSLSGEEYIYLDKTPEVTWYGWDGDRLTTTETATQRVQTIYLPGSFTPLVRVETDMEELAKAARRTLAEKFQQEANMTFPPELVALVDTLEAELQHGELSETNRAWLAQCGLTPEQIQNQMEPEYTPQRKIHVYHCDHRGLPLALVNAEGKAEWSAEYDAWGNVLRENNPHNLKQLIRLPGQQYDKETGLYYNRHRYYDPLQGRYITQDPIGLKGGWNFYQYPLDPIIDTDPLGLVVPLVVGVGVICAFGVLSSATIIQNAQQSQTDSYGRRVNPESDQLTTEHKTGINPGGNCTPDELSYLQSEKNRLCNQSRACAPPPRMQKEEIFRRYQLNLACASVRKTINNSCFGGGDKVHMDEENKAYKTAADCSGLLK